MKKSKLIKTGYLTGKLNRPFSFSKGKPYTYVSYEKMIERCYNKRHDSYTNYGERGITVCKTWLGNGGYNKFIDDMGERPYNKTLDRIDPNGNYCKENCKWSTKKQQARNKRK